MDKICKTDNISTDEVVEQLELLSISGRNAKWQLLWKTVSHKVKQRGNDNLFTHEIKTCVHTKTGMKNL